MTDEYSKLIAGAEIDFQGQTYNLAQMGPFGQSTDREVRKAASAATAFFESKEADFDRVYDELVKSAQKSPTNLASRTMWNTATSR